MLYLTEDIYGFDLDEALGTLPPLRREQALGLRCERDRRLCAAAYMLLRQALLVEHGIDGSPELGWREGGKPFIVGHEDIHFNMSHCRVAAACAVGGRPVGVDIETVRPFNADLARRVLNGGELTRVEASARPDVEFTRLWTMKESLLKMTGEGIRRDLRGMSLAGAHFSTTVNLAAGYVCTVCTPEEIQ